MFFIILDEHVLFPHRIGQKLEGVGYKSHWYGKGHTGYMSMNHLPHRIGFSSGHLGFLSGGPLLPACYTIRLIYNMSNNLTVLLNFSYG